MASLATIGRPPRWRGSKQIHEQPGSPDYTENAAGEVVTRVFKGPYAVLYSTRPRKGGQMIGWAGYYVDEVNVKPLEAGVTGAGIMTVKLTNTYLDPEQPSDEVEWIEVAKPLEQAPIYMTGGARVLTDADLDKIAEFKAAETSAKRAAIYAASTANARHLMAKLRRGQDTYVTYAPLHRRTFRSYTSPASTKCGKKVAPPSGAPDGYQWLRVADRGVRQGGQGKWEKVIETQGADLVDEDLYPTG